MIVLQIIGWILGILLLLLVLIGCIRLSLRAGYCESPLLTVGIGPLKIDLTEFLSAAQEPDTPKKAKKAKPAAPKEQPKKKPKEDKPPKLTEKPTLTETVTAFKDLAAGILRRLARHVKLDELRLRVLVASDDAAKTAMEYGTVCAAAGAVRSAAEGMRRVDLQRVHVEVECDFLAETPEIDAELCISVRVWRLALIALFAARPLIEALDLLKAYSYYKKEEKHNGNTHETTDRTGN